MSYSLHTEMTWAGAYYEVEDTFRKWRVRDFEINANVMASRAMNTGLSRVDRAVTVNFVKEGATVTLTLGSQQRPVDNLRAIGLTLENMRMIERRGLAEVAQAAYLQLAAPEQTRDPFEVLGLRPDAPVGLIDAAYKTLAKGAHPDKGGSEEAMAELNEARDLALERVGS